MFHPAKPSFTADFAADGSEILSEPRSKSVAAAEMGGGGGWPVEITGLCLTGRPPQNFGNKGGLVS